MTLRIAQQAPDFEVDTTQGRIKFHEWMGNGWALLFSHPKDFTPVCTTELGALAKLEPEFKKRNTKVLGLSVDPVGDHNRWFFYNEAATSDNHTNPLVGDSELKVAKLYD